LSTDVGGPAQGGHVSAEAACDDLHKTSAETPASASLRAGRPAHQQAHVLSAARTLVLPHISVSYVCRHRPRSAFSHRTDRRECARPARGLLRRARAERASVALPWLLRDRRALAAVPAAARLAKADAVTAHPFWRRRGAHPRRHSGTLGLASALTKTRRKAGNADTGTSGTSGLRG
jgi:hypothetical protein